MIPPLACHSFDGAPSSVDGFTSCADAEFGEEEGNSVPLNVGAEEPTPFRGTGFGFKEHGILNVL